VILSSKGLERAKIIERDSFRFIIGSEEFKCSRFQAAFISKAVHRLLCSDFTIDSFALTGVEDGASDFFNIICALIEGRPIVLDESNCERVSRVGEVLENDELLAFVMKFQESVEAISVSNCISRLRMRVRTGLKIEEALKFVASHFYELEIEELKGLTNDLLEAVVSHSDLRLIDEDSFLEFIFSLGDEYSTLYGYVEFRFLSISGIDKFLSRISKENCDSQIWNSICRRLQCEIVNREVNCRRFSSTAVEEFVFSKGHEFDGILSSLTKKCGGNVHEKGIVNITSSGDAGNKCWQVADHGWTGFWASLNVPNSWICFDFRNTQISVKSYTLNSDSKISQIPVHWVVEGSNDQNNWMEIDKKDTQELDGRSIVKNFSCSTHHSSKFFRFIRLRQTGINNSNYDYFCLRNIEFFGVLK
jgi:hypothetical protein